jgi:hypothetical protein
MQTQHFILYFGIITLFIVFVIYFKIKASSKKKVEPKKKVEKILLDEEEIYNVENFNNWFNDKNKPKEIYAHPGIFLRTDKLSQSHFEYYFEHCGIENGREYCEGENWYKYKDFENEVIKDWFKKLRER